MTTKNKNLLTDRLIKEWLTSLLGLAMMIFAGLLLWRKLDSLTWDVIAMASALGALGFVFLFVKDSIITSFLPKR